MLICLRLRHSRCIFRFLIPDDRLKSWICIAIGGTTSSVHFCHRTRIFRFLIPEEGKDGHKCTTGWWDTDTMLTPGSYDMTRYASLWHDIHHYGTTCTTIAR
jgi:hypothetical protein